MLDHFRKVEEEWLGRKSGAHSFTQYGEWHIRRDFLQTVACYPFRRSSKKIPGLNWRTVSGVLRSSLKGKFIRIESNASAFMLDKNETRIRAFYPYLEQPATLKIVAGGGEKLARARQDLAMRTKLTNLEHLKLPKFLLAEEGDDFCLSAESLLYGRKFHRYRDAKRYGALVVAPMLQTYKTFGIRAEPIKPFLKPTIGSAIETLYADGESELEFAAYVEALLGRDGKVAVSLCHGDLVTSNIAIVDGASVFLDWEYARDWIPAFDLFRALSVPKHRNIDAMMNGLRAHFGAEMLGPDYSLAELFTLFIADYVATRPHQKRDVLDFWVRYGRD